MGGRPHRARNSGLVAVDAAVARPAARRVAHHASNATECAELLAMLGLTAQQGKGKAGPTSTAADDSCDETSY